jgi:glyoxylase-like metal-dependent hydrolase (beta-lactamase superfamily II)
MLWDRMRKAGNHEHLENKKRLSHLPVAERQKQFLLTNETNEFGFNAFVMHTPGHSPGSISVIIDNEIAIVGDAMFGVFRNSVFPPFADDLKQMVLSWGKLLETECTSFLPGHGTEKNRGLLQRQFEKYKARYKL